MRKTILAMTAVALVLAFGGTASAVVYGQADGNRHPNVGALLAPHADPPPQASCPPSALRLQMIRIG